MQLLVNENQNGNEMLTRYSFTTCIPRKGVVYLFCVFFGRQCRQQ